MSAVAASGCGSSESESSSGAAVASSGTAGGGHGASGSGAGGAQGGGGSGAAGNGGGGGGAPPGCDPASNPDGVSSSCGIFVSSSLGKDSNPGTQTKPVKTLAHALAIAGDQPVYACGEDFTEALSVPAGTTLFGALDCHHGWSYDAGTRTHLTAAHDKIPLTLAKGSGTTRVSDFEIDAVDATDDGGSSIGVLVDEVEAEFRRSVVNAGAGAPAAAWSPQPQVVTPASADATAGSAGCSGAATLGGP
ncbi:MAG TPA: hypothetical protein VHF26_20235, partial [Trebonia sp.]|nr:hypothetical protein [Trebonia sp.]